MSRSGQGSTATLLVAVPIRRGARLECARLGEKKGFVSYYGRLTEAVNVAVDFRRLIDGGQFGGRKTIAECVQCRPPTNARHPCPFF